MGAVASFFRISKDVEQTAPLANILLVVLILLAIALLGLVAIKLDDAFESS